MIQNNHTVVGILSEYTFEFNEWCIDVSEMKVVRRYYSMINCNVNALGSVLNVVEDAAVV